MTENKRARQVKKTDCLVIGWYDGATPKVLLNGTDEDLKNGAKLYCEYSEVERLEYEREAASALSHERIVNLESKLRVLEEKLQYHDKIVDHNIDLHMNINALESENAELKQRISYFSNCMACDDVGAPLEINKGRVCVSCCKPHFINGFEHIMKIAALESQLKDFQQVVSFYASFQSWDNLAGTGDCCIIEDDYDDGAGGKIARAMQRKWGSK